MGMKDVVSGVCEVCIEACRNVGRTVVTLPTCYRSDGVVSVDPCTREEIIEEEIVEQEIIGDEVIQEEMPAKSAAGGASSRSRSVIPRRLTLELLRSQCSNEFEYNIKKSTEHWTEVFRESTVDPILFSANSERFRELMEQWRCPKSAHGFSLDYGELLKMGPKIAEGGQAEIFDASFEGEEKAFVLKVFKDARLEDLERLWPPPLLSLLYVDCEPDWMRKERHCCWIRGGTLLKDGRFAFLMVKHDGDLRSVIDRKMRERRHRFGPFRLQHALIIMRDIAIGMRSLHRRGILHRDLKASNVLVRHGGALPQFAVADFETSVGVLGTEFWRAPEVLLALKTRTFGPEIWTEKVDVYSYAMTCYEVITGHIPFEGRRLNDYDFVLNGGRPPVPHWYRDWVLEPGVDEEVIYCRTPDPSVMRRRYPVPWLDNLLERCWHPDPLERPSFEEIVSAFKLATSDAYFVVDFEFS